MRLRSYIYNTNCVSSTARLIEDMTDQEITIGWRAFIRHVPISEIKNVFPFYDWSGIGLNLHIKDDYAVSFHRSKFNGQRCYYIKHSAIEYIFTEQEAA